MHTVLACLQFKEITHSCQNASKMHTQAPELFLMQLRCKFKKAFPFRIPQMTFSSHKNTNTYEVLMGISPSGAVTFVSKVYPGSISDSKLTRSGILDLLQSGDSVMADHGFDIQDLTLINVKLKIPPFSRKKTSLQKWKWYRHG